MKRNVFVRQVALISFSLVCVLASVVQAYLRITVSKSQTLNVLSSVVGWIYFVAWSVSFYPQVSKIISNSNVNCWSGATIENKFILNDESGHIQLNVLYRGGPNSERDSIMPWAVKSSFYLVQQLLHGLMAQQNEQCKQSKKQSVLSLNKKTLKIDGMIICISSFPHTTNQLQFMDFPPSNYIFQ